jgi:hypothetical protein
MGKPVVLAKTADDSRFIQRAVAAHYRQHAHERRFPAPTPAEDSCVAELDGRRYVILRGADGRILRVYRVRLKIEQLHQLKRWPKELEEALP